MLVAIALAGGLVGYLALSRNALKLAQRTLYTNDAAQLAEAGLESAVYCFRSVDSGTAAADAWTGWTLQGANASRTLPTFVRNQNSIGLVKVYVTGYDGSSSAATVIAQAKITPVDGSPAVIRSLKIGLSSKGGYPAAIVSRSDMQLGSHSIIDSYDSNPGGGTPPANLAYPGNGARTNGDVIVLSGKSEVGSNGLIKGNLMLGNTVTAPPQSKVTGTITSNKTGSYPVPATPTIATVSRGYTITTIPATLPRTGDLAASDGRFYYFASGTLGNSTITANSNVTVVTRGVSVNGALTIPVGSTLTIYSSGEVKTQGNGGIDNKNGAASLQIICSGTDRIDIAQKTTFYGCIYAPNAEIRANGGGSSPEFVGALVGLTVKTSSKMAFHYDESLARGNFGFGGSGWSVTKWFDLLGTTEGNSLTTTTGGFLN